LGALIFAPWAYGGTTAQSIVEINWLLGSALFLRLIASLIRPGERNTVPGQPAYRTRAPRILLVASVAILILGWWMVFNAKAIYDSSYWVFVPLPHFRSGMPGSVDYAVSAAWMIRATLLLAVIWFVAELSRNLRWLMRLWWTIVLAGGSIATLGLLQKATGAEMIFWQEAPVRDVTTFFATYYYHGNAGAFLNLTLPATAGLTLRVFTRPTQPVVRAIALSLLVILVVAIFANTSRMAQLIGAALLIVLLVRFMSTIFRQLSKTEINFGLAGIAVVLIALYAVAQASHLEQPLSRWQKLREQLPSDPRWAITKRAFVALPETGICGTGPGTFRTIFLRYSAELPEPIPRVWRFLHEDYLQTLVEWGWIGGTFWALIFFGGFATGVQNVRRQEKFRRAAKIDMEDRTFEFASEQTTRPPNPGPWGWTSRQRLLLPLSVLALIGVAVHALVDFPLQIASIQLYVATLLGICWGSGGWSTEERVRKGKLKREI
jgi:O-antigen ligase/polysaccharide polymerase Wzy-like membrane protein